MLWPGVQASAGPRQAADNTNVNASPKQQEDDRWGDNIVLAAATLPADTASPAAPAAPAAPLDPGSGEPQPGAHWAPEHWALALVTWLCRDPSDRAGGGAALQTLQGGLHQLDTDLQRQHAGVSVSGGNHSLSDIWSFNISYL